MKRIGYGLLVFLLVTSFGFIVNCGSSGGGTAGGTGTVTMNVTDAKPALPVDDIEQVLITVDEIMLHKSGGGWERLNLANNNSEYQIDLLQYSNGNTTAIVLPKEVASGKYTQIRFGVKTAKMVSTSMGDIDLEIPSDYLKTDKNFEFDLPTGQTVNLTIDFDLSQSIVATGSGTYQLKPVLHVVKAPTTIEGSISEGAFGIYNTAIVVVTWDKDHDGAVNLLIDEEYTRLDVEKSTDPTTPFKIYWLVPNNSYIVQIYINGEAIFNEPIPFGELPEGTEYILNGGDPIDPPAPT